VVALCQHCAHGESVRSNIKLWPSKQGSRPAHRECVSRAVVVALPLETMSSKTEEVAVAAGEGGTDVITVAVGSKNPVKVACVSVLERQWCALVCVCVWVCLCRADGLFVLPLPSVLQRMPRGFCSGFSHCDNPGSRLRGQQRCERPAHDRRRDDAGRCESRSRCGFVANFDPRPRLPATSL